MELRYYVDNKEVNEIKFYQLLRYDIRESLTFNIYNLSMEKSIEDIENVPIWQMMTNVDNNKSYTVVNNHGYEILEV